MEFSDWIKLPYCKVCEDLDEKSQCPDPNCPVESAIRGVHADSSALQ